jgi:hypothetical protein
VLQEEAAPYSSGGAINMNAPIITIGCVSNLYSRQMYFINKGDVELGHTHLYDHFTLLATGSLRVTIDGADTVFTAPNMIFIRKDKNHKLEALEDNTVAYCIHPLRNNDKSGDIMDPSMIPMIPPDGGTYQPGSEALVTPAFEINDYCPIPTEIIGKTV